MNERSKQLRRDVIALSKANGGYHYGGSFSCVEILIALFDHVMGPDDQFVLSKGHACWPLYVLLRERGLNPRLSGHPERDPHNGIWATTGSLGHGLPVTIGMAQAKRMLGDPGRIFILMGDGECQAGTIWESMLIASRLRLDNLVVIVDWNGIQGSDFCEAVLPLTPGCLATMASMAGWNSEIISEGNNQLVVKNRLELPWIQVERGGFRNTKPLMHIIKTTKGKGVSFMENNPKWHSCWLNSEQEKQALEELS